MTPVKIVVEVIKKNVVFYPKGGDGKRKKGNQPYARLKRSLRDELKKKKIKVLKKSYHDDKLVMLNIDYLTNVSLSTFKRNKREEIGPNGRGGRVVGFSFSFR